VNPSLYQINTKVLLSELGPGATLDDVPNSFLDAIASRGFDWVWLLGVWKIGPTGRRISRQRTEWHHEYLAALPDLTDEDICGSPFAVCEYVTDPSIGGDKELSHFRDRLEQRGIALLLDFVPNHIGFDHRWVNERPDFLVRGTDRDLLQAPDCWTKLPNGTIAAYGKDPNYPGWPDTLQLNFFNPHLRAAMIGELRSIATRCSGVRCDMAMLIEPEVFARTWNGRPEARENFIEPWWPDAIAQVRRDHPDFLFLAEVYWNYEKKLQEQGFSYTYDKVLYDRLIHHEPKKLSEYLRTQQSYSARMTHFLENHDEPRIASRLAPPEHTAAAVVSYLTPGMRFFHHGQLEGYRVRVPVHLCRGPHEEGDLTIAALYDTLLPIVNSPVGKYGAWHLLRCAPAWADNPTNENFIAYYIAHDSGDLLVTVNYASYRGQCFVELPQALPQSGNAHLKDLLSDVRYERDARDLLAKGLYLDVEGFTAHVFSVTWTTAS
jgi:glycosidase